MIYSTQKIMFVKKTLKSRYYINMVLNFDILKIFYGYGPAINSKNIE